MSSSFPDEPTRLIPPVPPVGPPPAGPPPVAYGGPPPGEPPSNPNRTIAAVAIGLAVVLLILIGLLLLARHKSKSSSTTTTSTSVTTSTSTTAAPTTTVAPTTAAPTTAAPTTVPPTTAAPTTAAAQAVPTGNRPPTAAEQRQILADVDDSHPGYQVTTLRIANSDNSWAALKYAGGPSQQPFEEVRHLSGGHWQSVATGTAQVACDPSVPVQVQRDFADVLGGC